MKTIILFFVLTIVISAQVIPRGSYHYSYDYRYKTNEVYNTKPPAVSNNVLYQYITAETLWNYDFLYYSNNHYPNSNYYPIYDYTAPINNQTIIINQEE